MRVLILENPNSMHPWGAFVFGGLEATLLTCGVFRTHDRADAWTESIVNFLAGKDVELILNMGLNPNPLLDQAVALYPDDWDRRTLQ